MYRENSKMLRIVRFVRDMENCGDTIDVTISANVDEILMLCITERSGRSRERECGCECM